MFDSRRSAKFLLRAMQFVLLCIVLLFPAAILYLYFFILYPDDFRQASYAQTLPRNASCTASLKYSEALNGGQGIKERSKEGFGYWLKTPQNYSSENTWPLLIVFSPVMSGKFMEAYTGLTASVTKAGFIVAYVDSTKISMKTISALQDVPRDIMSKWCVDSSRVFLAGHSDGATISQALHFLPSVELSFSGFISSAAGISGEDLQTYDCVAPNNVFILHNTGDRHFRDFGEGVAQWWASCNECQRKDIQGDGCVEYSDCQQNAVVKFCEQRGGHLRWPARQDEIVDFLKRVGSV